MTMIQAITCDTDICIALYVGQPGQVPELIRLGAQRVGWDVDRLDGPHRCPSCHRNGESVLEAGECPACRGRTTTLRHGEACQYCGHVLPPLPDELDDEDPTDD
ncbi:hypothetical protein ACFQWA_27790 [Streptomyces thermogriseus]|uniref:hypothetical protein n=1 Tax=Streptomyces thermogriseus TaxID=75292 RepID=UPI00360A9DC9